MHGGVDHREGLHHHGDGLQLAHLVGHGHGRNGVDDVEDLLAARALGGQDGARGQDLEEEEEEREEEEEEKEDQEEKEEGAGGRGRERRRRARWRKRRKWKEQEEEE